MSQSYNNTGWGCGPYRVGMTTPSQLYTCSLLSLSRLPWSLNSERCTFTGLLWGGHSCKRFCTGASRQKQVINTGYYFYYYPIAMLWRNVNGLYLRDERKVVAVAHLQLDSYCHQPRGLKYLGVKVHLTPDTTGEVGPLHLGQCTRPLRPHKVRLNNCLPRRY